MIVARIPARLGLGLLLLLSACGTDPADPTSLDGFETEARVVLTSPEGQEVTVEVAVADTEAQRRRGLMGVESLPEEAGMVFLRDEPAPAGFWMKDTLVPLSVAVWDETGTIREIVDMEPCAQDPCPVYEVTEAWVGAVEVNRGFFGRHGIGVGSTASLEGHAAPAYGAPSS